MYEYNNNSCDDCEARNTEDMEEDELYEALKGVIENDHEVYLWNKLPQYIIRQLRLNHHSTKKYLQAYQNNKTKEFMINLVTQDKPEQAIKIIKEDISKLQGFLIDLSNSLSVVIPKEEKIKK